MTTLFKYKYSLLAIWLIFPLAIAQNTMACTSFFLRNGDDFVVGRNYDYKSSQGVIMINPRNLVKSAIPFPGEKSAKWISKYGSITFNALGREQPNEGINEAGLIVTGLSVEDATKYPSPDDRPAVDMLQWIQYILDNYTTVKEVIDELGKIRVSNQSAEASHLLISDAIGEFAIIEYIEGKLTFHINDFSTSGFICNDYFSKSTNDIKKYAFKGGSIPTIKTFEKYTPEEAIVIGASMIEAYDKNESLEKYAFNILSTVNAPTSTPFYKNYGTQWSVVYDSKNKKLTFTTLHNKNKRVIDLSKINFIITAPILALTVSESKINNIYDQFNVFSADNNFKLMCDGVKGYYNLDALPDDLKVAVEMAAMYPYNFYIQTKK